jgi:hypothetical protein
VYALFDGFGVWLRANDHREQYCTDKVYLEPDVLKALILYEKREREQAINHQLMDQVKRENETH